MKTDLTYLREMSAGNKELAIEMIDLFKTQVEEFYELMDESMSKQEWVKLGQLAHKAKSSVSIMGLNDLAAEMKQLETKAKKGIDTDSYAEVIAKFKSETAEVVSELNQIKENISEYF
jgi:HPt (histidine-containing phosphotransfer) domain-containing protein